MNSSHLNHSQSESLSDVKRNFYSLAKEIRGIESRILKLTEEEGKRRKKLENLKSKNDLLKTVKKDKVRRHNYKDENSNELSRQLEDYKNKNHALKVQHNRLVNDIHQSINQERRQNFKEIKQERDKNEEVIRLTKKSFIDLNRSMRNKVVDMEEESRKKVRDYWVKRSADFNQTMQKEAEDYKKMIKTLQDSGVILQKKEKDMIESLRRTDKQVFEESQVFVKLTGSTKKGSPHKREIGSK